jgi:ketopantoate hydroxymethyltransferase
MSDATQWPADRRITIRDLQAATDRGERWSMLTSYDTLTAGVFEQAGVRALLVGDTSAEMVLGYPDTVPVTMDELVPMVQAVVRGTRTALEAAGAFAMVLESVAGRARAAGLRRAADPHGGHRGRPGLRRPDPGLAGHGGPRRRQAPAVRQAHADTRDGLLDAARRYVADVADRRYPDQAHSYI